MPMCIWESLIRAIFSGVNELSKFCLELTRPSVLIFVYMTCFVDIVVVLCFLTLFAPSNITLTMHTQVTVRYIRLSSVGEAVMYMVDETSLSSKLELQIVDVYVVYLPAEIWRT